MILLKLTGGLGNQMFQYACGKSISTKLKVPLFLDLTWYRKSDRKFILDKMKIEYSYASSNHFVAPLINKIKKPVIIKDKGYFSPIEISAPNKNILIEGYWESYKYFIDQKELFKNNFKLKNPSEKLSRAIKEIAQNSISVHVRRGDYLIPHGKYVNGLEYCNEAVDQILKHKTLKNPTVTIFSDDTKWCKENLATLAGVPTTVFTEKMDSDAEELILMSHHENNVISNSTFSWWAAFLNDHPNKMVVMPQNWFTDKDFNQTYMSNLRLPEWVVI